MPTGYRKNYRKPYTPNPLATKKTIRLAWRESLDTNRWENEVLTATGHSVSEIGVLTVFCAGSVIWTLASGYWRSVVLIGEEAPAVVEPMSTSAEGVESEQGPM